MCEARGGLAEVGVVVVKHRPVRRAALLEVEKNILLLSD